MSIEDNDNELEVMPYIDGFDEDEEEDEGAYDQMGDDDEEDDEEYQEEEDGWVGENLYWHWCDICGALTKFDEEDCCTDCLVTM